MKNRSALVLLAAAACCAAMVVGCESSSKDKKAEAAPAAAPKQASMGVVNTKCPVMPSHEAGSKATTSYQGQTVGFCCAGCVPKWNAMTDAQKAEALAKAK